MTVAELAYKLDKLGIELNPGMPVCIRDADAECLLNIQSVTTRTSPDGEHVITLEGDYGSVHKEAF